MISLLQKRADLMVQTFRPELLEAGKLNEQAVAASIFRNMQGLVELAASPEFRMSPDAIRLIHDKLKQTLREFSLISDPDQIYSNAEEARTPTDILCSLAQLRFQLQPQPAHLSLRRYASEGEGELGYSPRQVQEAAYAVRVALTVSSCLSNLTDINPIYSAVLSHEKFPHSGILVSTLQNLGQATRSEEQEKVLAKRLADVCLALATQVSNNDLPGPEKEVWTNKFWTFDHQLAHIHQADIVASLEGLLPQGATKVQSITKVPPDATETQVELLRLAQTFANFALKA